MRMYDIIANKKHGKVLTKEEIEFVVKGYTAGEIPDYQVSALLMAICFQGMTAEETAILTMAMAHSGDMIDLSSIEGIKVDKHSTGGVGDKTTIVLAPLVAAAGVKVAKMSGRGLGHTGGTVDKLESFDGFKIEISEEQFIDNVNTHGIAVVGQSGDLAPADKKLYALRDVTATVDHIALIASSIMSKKIASGAEAIVLDVKCGSGAFMKNLDDARALGRAMVDIGKHVGRNTVAVVSDMSQPLGFAVGNALEIIEAIETLKGNGPEDLTALTIALGSRILVLAKVCDTIEAAEMQIKEMFANGKAVEKLKEWIGLQGGNVAAIDDYSLLPGAVHTRPVYLNETGYVKAIDAEEVGKSALLLGAGRETKESSIDLGVGLIIHNKIGDKVSKDEPVATIYYNDDRRLEEAVRTLVEAYEVTEEVVSKNTLIYDLID
ncbi:pyrimidine-nucleoside phosphorylase [Cellulosilyticum ruminicola]|uniref:pyrimidine-nucleoside phosphorylase n=1 Tax=Cellulosilyticum ruminicola TaxID=425254 RepID=UPI0006D1CBAA|nr:pyrimidine-nucleoside phosphorylase [Cellulosilyticum ruminicola]